MARPPFAAGKRKDRLFFLYPASPHQGVKIRSFHSHQPGGMSNVPVGLMEGVNRERPFDLYKDFFFNPSLGDFQLVGVCGNVFKQRLFNLENGCSRT